MARGAARSRSSDVRHAIRALAKNPGFSLTVFAVLTLGIGLNAAVFTMLKSLALSPLAGVERLGAASAWSSERDERRPSVSLSYPDYQYVRDHDRAFAGLIGIRQRQCQPRTGQSRRARSWASS